MMMMMMVMIAYNCSILNGIFPHDTILPQYSSRQFPYRSDETPHRPAPYRTGRKNVRGRNWPGSPTYRWPKGGTDQQLCPDPPVQPRREIYNIHPTAPDAYFQFIPGYENKPVIWVMVRF